MKQRVSWPQYDAVWRCIHERVFSGNDADENPFRDRTWKLVLLTGGLALELEAFESLAKEAVRVGDSGVVVVDPQEKFANEEPIVLGWELSCFEEVDYGTVYGHIEAHVFGRSGRWGLVTSPETFAVLGGEKTLVDEFLKGAGGEQSVRANFLRSAEAGEIGFGEAGKRYIERLLEMVGWDNIRGKSSERSGGSR